MVDESAAGRARNTIIFSIATGLSRIAGLLREMVAGAIYGATGAASAFTIAYAVPNLLRSLFADMALSAAFVPVFTELLEQKRRREALLLISTLFWVLLGALAILCAVAMLTAPLYMPLFVGDKLHADLGSAADPLTVGLSQVMMPTVLLLGLNGLFVGALNANGHFTIPAISPLVWNFVIIGVNLALLPAFDGNQQIYAQAIGVLVGTVVQLLMAVPVLRRYGIRLVPRVDLHDPRLRQVLVLMVPVALSLGLINFSALIDSILASHVSDDGPRAIESAFRLYMLPQGIFSVAIVTVLFPVLSRAVARRDFPELRGLIGSGMAQILVLLVPIGLLFMSPVIAHDIVQTLYQRGKWSDANTDAAATALVWLGASLALNGVSLLLSRTFFALQRPWANTALALGSLVANVVMSVALYRPLGLAGIVIGTLIGNIVLVSLQIRLLRKETGGPLGLAPVARSLLRVLVASVVAVAAATAVALLGRVGADALGTGTAASAVTILYLGLAVLAGGVTYVGMAQELGLEELERAGGRFVRLADRLRGKLLRLPGVSFLLAFWRRPFVGRVAELITGILSLLALPLGVIAAVAAWLSRRLVSLVPAGPVVAVATSPGGPPTGPSGGAPVAEREARRAGPRGSAGRARRRAQESGGAGWPDEPTGDATRGTHRYEDRPPYGTAGDEAPTGPGRADGYDAPAYDAPAAPGQPGPYDAVEDWPTAGYRDGGETLDVPWPGGDRPASEPSEQQLRHEEALRMIAEREAALERIAERERRRREGPPPRGGRRGRRGR